LRKIFSSLIIFVLVLAIGGYIPTSNAHAESSKKTILVPEKETEHTFKEVSLMQESGKDIVNIGEKKANDDTLEGFKITINKEKKTYKAKKLKKDEIKKYEIPKDELVTVNSTYTHKVTAITDDVPGEDLAITTQTLTWNGTSTGASYVSRSKTAWANSYTNLATTWYVGSNSWVSLSTIDAGRTVYSKNHAYYYNYDWLYDSQITEVTHDISIYGYYTGGWDYYVSHTHTGESGSILDLDIVTQ